MYESGSIEESKELTRRELDMYIESTRDEKGEVTR